MTDYFGLVVSEEKNTNWVLVIIVLLLLGGIVLAIVLLNKQPVACSPNYQCTNWGQCINSQQTRNCSDLNSCLLNQSNIPILTQSCSVTCTPNWVSGAWSQCTNNIQTRVVTDSNNCGTTQNKPITSQSCSVACTPNWVTGSWSTCSGGTQSRIVTDSNNCGVSTNKPLTNQNCTISCTPSWSCGTWGNCSSNSQIRVCTDSNNCGVNTNKPIVSQGCNSQDCSFTTNAIRRGNNWVISDYLGQGLRIWVGIDINGDGIKETFSQGVITYDCLSPDYNYFQEIPTHAFGGFTIRLQPNSNQLLICDGNNGIMMRPYVGDTIESDAQKCNCVPEWQCSVWSTCSGTIQTRTCNDINSCGTRKPVEVKSCNIITTTTQCGGVECNGPQPGTCDICLSDCHVCYPNRIKSSDYGVYKLYLASSLQSGIGLNQLINISEIMRRRIYIASEGVLNNFEFYYDALSPDLTKPNVNPYDMTSMYYFMSGTDVEQKEPLDYNNLPFSIAWWSGGTGISEGMTRPVASYSLTSDDIYAYHDTIHEFGHTVSCGDDYGNIMRCIEGLCDYNKYPPHAGGIDGIEENIKNGNIRLK